MSLASWRREFYRKPAHEVSKRHALRHSLKKWMGLKRCNLKKHNVVLCDCALANVSGHVSSYDSFEVDDKTCALCQHFIDNNCKGCPLTEAGITPCQESDSPFETFLVRGSVGPMIKALEKTLEKGKKR